jgi:hypothetical protein
MVILRIEHPVPDDEGWKKSGVRRYRIMRAVDNPKTVMIDLEFDTT